MRKLVDSRLSSLIAGSVCAVVLGPASTAYAQRVIFPSPVDNGTAPMTAAAAPTSNITAPVYTAQLQGGSPSAPAYSTPPTYAAPSASPYAAPSAIAQPAPYGNPVLPYNPAQPPQAFDPYGTAPPSLAPPTYTGPPPGYNDGFFPTAFRLLQEARFQHTYIARTGNQGSVNSFGLNDDELFLSFGFPICKSNAPLLITPGFNFHFFDGPNSQGIPNADLPPTVYDAYLASSWRPQITQRFAADLAVSVGVYSDFTFVNNNSIRVLGRAIGIYAVTPQWSVAAGAMYLNRLAVTVLPAAGLIWTPHPDARYELLFPNPKLSQRITTYGNTDIWGYVRGEYGGGQWTVTHTSGVQDTVNYNDLRLILGVDWFYLQRVRGNFEVGYVFDRQILYLSGVPTSNPADSVMLRAGLSY